jgi:hypothetical protein
MGRRATKIILGDQTNPLVEITPYTPDPALLGPTQALTALQVAALTDLIGHSLQRGLQGFGPAGGVYRIVFAPQITHQLTDGTLQLMRSGGTGFRALAVDGTHQIVGQASLVPARVSPSMLTSFWFMLSVASAQHSLKTIEHRLKRLEQGIDEIKAWLMDGERGTLRSNLSVLREYRASMLAGTLTAADHAALVSHLERIALDCERQRMLFEGKLKTKQQDVLTYDLTNVFSRSSSDTLLAFRKELNGYSRLAALWFTVAWVNLESCWLRSTLAVDHTITAQRLQLLEEMVETWREEQRIMFGRLADRQAALTTGIERFLRLGSNERERFVYGRLVANAQARVEKQRKRLVEGIALLKNQVQGSLQSNHPVQLIITVGSDGAIQEAHQIAQVTP